MSLYRLLTCVTQTTGTKVRVPVSSRFFPNNNDIVPRLPPTWMGFRHSGREMYLNRNGKLRVLNYWGKALDRIPGFFRTLLKLRIDWLSDHSIIAYIDAIEGICKRADNARGS